MAHRTLLKNWRLILAATVLLLSGTPGDARASWLFYHKPAFEGQILDAETKQPIEGAVVAALYHKWTIGLGAGSTHPLIHVKEALTDKDGKFRIPSYTTLIQPFSWSDAVIFIIYKPGYFSVDSNNTFYYEGLFSGQYPASLNITLPWRADKNINIIVRSPNIVELPVARTRDERLNAWRFAGLGVYEDEWSEKSILVNKLNEEENYLY